MGWDHPLHALPYYGGKSSGNINTPSRWIASLLPQSTDCTYIEPFAGMLGILLQRKRCTHEIINDRDGNITNFWKCLRDDGLELTKRVALSPIARDEWEACCKIVREGHPDDIERARALTVVLTQCMFSSPKGNSWTVSFSLNTPRRSMETISETLNTLLDRIDRIQIENKDACDLLAQTSDREQCVIYCDPPYPSTYCEHYRAESPNFDRMTELLKAQKGQVAVSGQNDDWDHLGWRVATLEGFRSITTKLEPTKLRVYERLWMNYAEEGKQLTLFDLPENPKIVPF